MQIELAPTGNARTTVVDLPATAALVMPLCRAIGLSDLVDALCPMKAGKHLRHGQVAEFIVLSILQEPKRPPLYKMNVWAEECGLEYLYGHAPAAFNDDRIGRTLDAMAGHLEEIDKAVSLAAARYADVKLQAAHWDFKHVSFSEGKLESDLVRPGYGAGSMHSRMIQFSLQMDSATGLPLHHEVLPGNTNQPRLAQRMFECLRERFEPEELIVIADRAAMDYDNITMYQGLNGRFLGPLRVVSPQIREQLACVPREQFTQLEYRSMHQETPLNYYHSATITLAPSRKAVTAAKKATLPLPGAAEVDALFIFNVDRQLDDEAHRRKALRKCLTRLKSIAERCAAPRSPYRGYDFALKEVKKAVRPLKGLVQYKLARGDSGLVLHYWVDRPALRAAKRSDGRYVLLHSLGDLYSPDEIFAMYRRQGALEAQFRGLSSDLEINPLWLHKQPRLKALVLLYYVAMIVFSTLGLLAKRAHLGTEHYHIMTPREMLHRCSSLNLIITRAHGQKTTYKLEMPERQKQILDALGLPISATWLAAPS